jgi:outer membrane protein assembly factor BamB
MRWLPLPAVLLLLVLGSACTSGGSPSCKTSGGTVLATTAWPKFRKDQANTGRTSVAIASQDVSAQRLFPPPDSTVGGLPGTPVLAGDRIYLGSNDTNVYVVDYAGQLVELDEEMNTDGAITATPVLGADGTLFVVSGDGRMRQFETDGKTRKTTTIGGFLSASPNIGPDGTVYFGSQAGSFTGVCANGAPRFLNATAPSASPPAVTADPDDPNDLIVVAGADNGQVRGFDRHGRIRWSLFASASATIRAAIVIDETSQRFFVADQTGRMFAGSLADGTDDEQFAFRASAAISASPALGDSVLYVADELGVVYAIDPITGNLLWQWSASEDIRLNDGIDEIGTSIRSSPALSAPTGGAERIVFGVDVDSADAFCSLETRCTVDDDCPTVNCCSDGVCTQTGTACGVAEGAGDCERVNSCQDGICAIRRGDCACSECAKTNLCVDDTCTETGSPCTSDDDCSAENLCVRSFLYAVEGGPEPKTLWRVRFDAAIGTASPAIGSDGTIYIGTEAGVLYQVTN